jgi:cation transport ATPase
MVAAALGFITPVEGALFQEIIDVAVILNALRALMDARSASSPLLTPREPNPLS